MYHIVLLWTFFVAVLMRVDKPNKYMFCLYFICVFEDILYFLKYIENMFAIILFLY